MTRTETYAYLAKRLGISVAIVRRYFEALREVAVSGLRRHGEFVVPGIVTIVVHKRKARMGRNPATGRAVRVQPATMLKVRVEKQLANVVREPTRKAGSRRRTDLEIVVGEGGSPGPVTPRPAYTPPPARDIIRVFFGTDRVPAAQPGQFKNRQTDPGSLTYGYCDVSIPQRHELGSVERPSLWRFEFRERRGTHFVIVSRHVETADAFWSSLRNAGQEAALLFIHGFRVTFDDAVYRAAQISRDLAFGGLTLLYSWASHGTLRRYRADGVTNRRTIPLLKNFITDVCARTGVSSVHVVAHSMGNRALAQGLYELALASHSARLANVILAAPDIDAGDFKNIGALMTRMSKRTTLYASSKDKALRESMRKHRFARAGDARTMVLVQGIDSIDASNRHTDFLDHSYFGDHESLLNDIHQIVNLDLPPSKRFALEGVPVDIPEFWKFLPSRR
jgi:esterase/lipase superfamily enzyme/nucleoid DNA-binding protein